jgi:YbgC/YbaW family acyl-CoA thioester hydrolase
VFLSEFDVRSYELDGFGHVNYAVYLNYLEQARFDALAAGGFPLSTMAERNWGVYVARVEVDYRRECRLGHRIQVRTWVESFRNSSMVIGQEILRHERGTDPVEGATAAEARIVAVWMGPDGRPMRIPPEVRQALAPEESTD